ncbi:MAG: aminotransferase class I/II-fold pyridoxal phosphate-dependent enzyme [Planctomycetota bacterium]
MALIGTIPRRAVNLPGGALRTLVGCTLRGRLVDGPDLAAFERRFADWLGTGHVLGAAQGRSAFQLALMALDLPQGAEIVFPSFTFPVMPMVAKLLGYEPVFCDVDPRTFNAGRKEIEAVLSDRTGAVLATHLFGMPCPIEDIAALARERGFRLMEDCAHALGVRVGGRSVGTFGDVGIFSFAEGKNMPCMGGGAIATADEGIAARARAVLAAAARPSAKEVRQEGTGVWLHWLATRPLVFGLTAYQVLKLKLRGGQPLMDSEVGDALLERFRASDPRIQPLANLQAAIGLRQLEVIDRFNSGARRNAEVLTEELGDVPGVTAPPMDGDHIYVYYPLRVDPALRDDLRHFLLRRGVDAKKTDMGDCAQLRAFREGKDPATLPPDRTPTETSILEICVYPILSERQMRRVARAIRDWSRLRRGPGSLPAGRGDAARKIAV